MVDFSSGVWSWLIGLVTAVSLIALWGLAMSLSGGRIKRPGEQAPSVGHVWDEDLHELNNPLPRWWLNLYLITLVWGAVYLILYPGLGGFRGYRNWTQEKQYQTEIEQADQRYGPLYAQYLNQDLASLAVNDDALAIGARLFSTYCTTCHGSDAGGASGYPNLTDGDWLYSGTPDAIQVSISDGRLGAMPAWQETLGTEGVFNVAEYVRAFSGHTADKTVAARGRELYTAHCAVCHGTDGKGSPALGAPDLTDDVWLYGGTQKRILESIAKGRNGQMPPHKEFLGAAKVHLLAAYVYSLSRD
jgi:cytochrome c oxidase cbb3-type subunit 3